MSFYPCRGGDGKSPLNNEFQVIGCTAVYELGKPQTVIGSRADADFIVLVSFYKNTDASGSKNFTVVGDNRCVCTLGKIGDSVTVVGVADHSNNTLKSTQKSRFTWESSNKVKIENVEGSPSLGGTVDIFFCKYI